MTAIPVSLGPRDFPTKSAAKLFVRTEILNGYSIGEPISNEEHIDVLLDILRRKANAAEKIGTGIAHFYVDHTRRFKSYAGHDLKTIVVHRTSGKDVDFGYGKIIDGSTKIDYVKDALRQAILDYRDQFKFSRFSGGEPAYSDIDGEPIAQSSDAEVRYRDPSWGKLTADFAESVGGWSSIETHSGKYGEAQIGRQLESDQVRKSWRDYWRANANPVLARKG